MAVSLVAAALAAACAQPVTAPHAQQETLVRVSGEVIERLRAWPREGPPHDLMKVRTAGGNVVLVDLGVPGGEGTVAKGDRVSVVGAPRHTAGEHVVFAHYVFEDTTATGPE